MFSILVVEDHDHLRRMMADRLAMEGYRVSQATDGAAALELMASRHVDLLVCDLMMPVMDGYTLTESLRAAGYAMPVLMVTALDSFADKEKGFRLGTDDYMVKPVDLGELVLRVAALLRRSRLAAERQMVIGGTVLAYDALTVTVNGMVTELPRKEFYLLYKLLSYPRQIFTRQQLMDEIWGPDAEVDERTVDSHIKKLRRRFEDVPDFRLVTIRGLGYKAERLL